jgi:L-ascorbate metabolism protein UlaG (beta-lactamase superfamily)
MKAYLFSLLTLCFLGGNMETKYIHWLGHASFRIEDDSTQIYIDPFKLFGNLPKADIIFITHGHFDHYSVQDIELIKKKGTIIVAPKNVADKVGKDTIGVVPNQNYVVGKLKVQTVPAYNLDKKFHPRENGWVGYIITLSNEQKIYHAGDTDFTPEMRTISVDVALMPCGGTYTMTAKEMAEAANVFKPKVLIPMHWGTIVGSKADADEVKQIFKGKTVVKVPEH